MFCRHPHTQESHHAPVVCRHFFGVIGVKHAPCFILFLSGMTEAAALAAVSRAGPKRRPVPLERHVKALQIRHQITIISNIGQTGVLPYMGGTLLVCHL